MLKSFVLASALSLAALPALADTLTATLTFSAPDATNSAITDTATLNLVGNSTATGQYLLSGISGTTSVGTTTSNVTGLIAPGLYPNSPGPASDNLVFYPAVDGGYLDYLGISYTLADGADVNLYYVAPAPDTISGYFFDINNAVPANGAFPPSNTPATVDSVSITPTTVTPEPASLALAGTGILLLAIVVRRRLAHA